MKHIQTLILMVVCGCVFTLATSATAQSTKPGVATVVRISGDARYTLGDGNWHPLVAGKVVAAGSVIQTGPDATVDLVLGKSLTVAPSSQPEQISQSADPNVRGFISYKPSAEQNTIRMTGDTVLAIDKLTVSDTGVDSVSDTELDLRQGGIYNSVKKLSGASQYLIKIPNGIAGVRGTLFYISATGACSVFKNSVVLSLIGADGKPATVVVGEGNQFNPQSGQTSPLPPNLTIHLNEIFTALRTTFPSGFIIFPFDRTECPISPTHGHH
jgi:FecR protein